MDLNSNVRKEFSDNNRNLVFLFETTQYRKGTKANTWTLLKIFVYYMEGKM